MTGNVKPLFEQERKFRSSSVPLRPRFFARDPFNNLIEFVRVEGDYLAKQENVRKCQCQCQCRLRDTLLPNIFKGRSRLSSFTLNWH